MSGGTPEQSAETVRVCDGVWDVPPCTDPSGHHACGVDPLGADAFMDWHAGPCVCFVCGNVNPSTPLAHFDGLEDAR